MTTKYCPLKMAAHALEAPVMTTLTWYCEEEDCAWYDCEAGVCSVLTMAASLAIMADTYAVPGQPPEHESLSETEVASGY